MLIGYFTEYKGYKGSIKYDYENGVYYGSLIDIKDLVTYQADNVVELFTEYCNAVDSYIEFKGVINNG